jgi:DNA-directed RNA polymerase specialized sigma24 family protein
VSDTLGYEAEPADVEAIVSRILADLDEATADPAERYHRLTAEQALHEAVARRITEKREEILARLNVGDGTGRREGRMSYDRIAQVIGRSRATAQQMVERGRTRL